MRVSRDERENFARGRGNARNTARDVCFFLSFSLRVRNVRFLIKMININFINMVHLFERALARERRAGLFSLPLLLLLLFYRPSCKSVHDSPT